MSSVIQSCEGAVAFSLGEPRSCSRTVKSLQKANKDRHNLTVCRRPKFATAMQRPTPGSKPWGKLRLFTSSERRKVSFNGRDRQIVNFGGTQMFYRHGAIAAAALSFAVLAPTGFASAADVPVSAAKPAADVPFFFVIDDRVTYSYIFTGAQPGMFTVNPNGTINAKTAKSVYSFTHFDAWAYGTNFFNISLFKSDHNDPAAPCINAGLSSTFATANCAGATEIYGLFRSTFGWNEIFNTKAFSIGPLHNISFEVGMDANTENRFFGAAKRNSTCRTRATSTSLHWCTGSS